MTFRTVSEESNDRIRQISLQLGAIRELEGNAGVVTSELLKVQKGIVFISLYAAIEYTLTATVSTFLNALKESPKKPNEYHKYILCTLLNAEFNSLRMSGEKSSWEKKALLIDGIYSEEDAVIDPSVFPSEGTNISHENIVNIWKMYHLPPPIVPVDIHPWMLLEIKDHRNAIAHGREKAAAIGSRFTSAALMERFNKVSLLCSHIIGAFEAHVVSEGYLK